MLYFYFFACISLSANKQINTKSLKKIKYENKKLLMIKKKKKKKNGHIIHIKPVFGHQLMDKPYNFKSI